MTENAEKRIRLQKYLSMAGVCSRRKGEALIREGRVSVNGKKIETPGAKIDPDRDRVRVDGESVFIQPGRIYIALHKPKGYVTSCSHPGKKIVLDLVSINERIFPVGRLDKDSTGLLLLTNDGRIHQKLSHPSYDHEKEYIVTTRAPVSDRDLDRMAAGMSILGSKTRPAIVKRLSDTSFTIVLQEGRNRQIRRMIRNLANHVVTLKRIRIAHIHIGKLPEGKWRYLDSGEIAGFFDISRPLRKTRKKAQ